MRTTPDKITRLEPNEVFVFGSNLAGRHGKGAAKDALMFGAKYGVGQGPCGQTYAIATKDERLRPLPVAQIKAQVERFLVHVLLHLETTFLVTPIGCGYAGYGSGDIAPMFSSVYPITIDGPKNVILPDLFLTWLLAYHNPYHNP